MCLAVGKWSSFPVKNDIRIVARLGFGWVYSQESFRWTVVNSGVQGRLNDPATQLFWQHHGSDGPELASF